MILTGYTVVLKKTAAHTNKCHECKNRSPPDTLAPVRAPEESGTEGPGLPRLPPGRHGLPREFVARNQRERLAAGIIATVAERGYHGATITQIAAAAGVSRRTFYGYYASKEKCFRETYQALVDFLSEAIAAAGAEVGEWPERVRAELATLLEALAANPDLISYLLLAPPAAGGEIAGLYRSFLERLLALLAEGRPAPPAIREPSEAAEYGLAGGLAALLVDKLKAGEGERIAELLPDLLELVLTPYLGRERAVEVARGD